MAAADDPQGVVDDEHPAEEEDSGEETNEDVTVSKGPATNCKSHFRNDESHPASIRYGVPMFLVCALILLINADIGSGVSAEYFLVRDGVVEEHQRLFNASIFSSVKKLWDNGSYPLAILIVLTSVVWPYVKLFLAFFAWFAPYQLPRRRERMIEVIDAVGKWSFVDIVVLVEIMVAFRSSIKLSPVVTLEIVVLAEWGFYGFVVATMMSLLATHFILHKHRQVHYHSSVEPADVCDHEAIVAFKERGGLGNGLIAAAVMACVIAFVCFLVGCLLDIYEVENTRGDVSFAVDYSVVSVGKAIPGSQLESNGFSTRFLQFMWFFLCVVMPLWATFLFCILFCVPLSIVWAERIFVMGEIAFAWSCAEVLLVSTIFAVLQMPTFGDGLIEADCTACFVIDTKLLGSFAVLCVGAVLSVGVNVWMYRRAHAIVFGA